MAGGGAEPAASRRPVLALTGGDPSGVGPELLLKLVAGWSPAADWQPLLIAERAALESLRTAVDGVRWERLLYLSPSDSLDLERLGEGTVPVVDPVGLSRRIEFGRPNRRDAEASLAAVDLGAELTLAGCADALVTGPVSKLSIATEIDAGFRGHTDYLAAKLGLERYGRDYLMAFLGSDLRVALLTTHLPLREAIAAVSPTAVVEALSCLDRSVAGRIALAGLNPHAGEGGLLGDDDQELLQPAVAEARGRGIAVTGPESPDTVFLRARRGEFDWVLALYHDQGLIAVKTVGFGTATNWTLGLPILRTSVDHGTAYPLAGRGVADVAPLRGVVATTLSLLEKRGRA